MQERTFVLLSVVVGAMIVGLFQLPARIEQVSVQNATSTVAVIPTKASCNNSHGEDIYFLDEDLMKRLPFCALVPDGSEDRFCYDWAMWDGHQGITVIDLDSNF
jgi:hypothetical protein